MSIEITKDLLSQYVGGQMHVFNLLGVLEDPHYQGEISSIELTGWKLVVNFAWLARYDERKCLWFKHDGETTYTTNVNIFQYRSFRAERKLQLGSGEAEQILFFTPKGSKSLLQKIQIVGYHKTDLKAFAHYLKTLPANDLYDYAAAWPFLGEGYEVVKTEYRLRGLVLPA